MLRVKIINALSSIFPYSILIVLFYFYCLNSLGILDSDFGWHLQTGRYILTHGIPKTDPFSYTMPSYQLIPHEWLTQIIIAKLFPVLGTIGLSIIFAFLAILPIGFQTILYKGKTFIPLLLMEGGAMITLIGLRPKQLDWLFAEILFLLFLSQKHWRSFRYFLPILMIFWVNLHGGFALGIGLIFLYIFLRFVFYKSINLIDIVVLLLSIIATFINPYGIYMWKWVYITMTDTKLHSRIIEWLPSFYFINLMLWTYTATSLFFIFKYARRFPKDQIAMYIILFIFGVSSYRNIPFWLLYSLPLTYTAIKLFSLEVEKIKFGKKRLLIIYRLFIVLILIVFALQYYPLFLLGKKTSFYPTSAITYLKIHPYSGQLFAPYEWGGYLIWQYPEKKVFIDGRMPSWRQHTNNLHESRDSFLEYESILNGKLPFSNEAKKYHITRVLFYKQLALPSSTTILTDTFSHLPPWLQSHDINLPLLHKQIISYGMHVLYEDNISVIYGN